MGITREQWRRMQARREGAGRPVDGKDAPCAPAAVVGESGVVLGVDPSLRGTGYGLLAVSGREARVLEAGRVGCPSSWSHSQCLARIGEVLRARIRRYEPRVCVVEGLFYAQNTKTALVMGQARGAVLLTAAEAGLAVYEIAPRKVKQAIVGYGGAGKLAVAKMVQRMLRLPELPAGDAADALALALTHLNESRAVRVQGRKAL